MARMGKCLRLCFIVIYAFSLFMITPINAQSISESSVPEFSLKCIDHSYDVPERWTITIDPFTGKTYNLTMPGYHQENKTIEITIKNPSGATYYNFRWKGHTENEWSYEPFNPANPYTLEYYKYVPYNVSTSTFIRDIPYNASTSTLTVFMLYFIHANAIPIGGEIDVQLQALYGNFDAVPSPSQPLQGGLYYDFHFNGTTSDWSPTQTVTIPATFTSPTPSPTVTPSPSLPNNGPTSSPNTDSELTMTLTWLIIGILVISVFSLLLYVRHLKRRKPQN